MSEANTAQTPAAIAAAIRTLDASALRTLAGLLVNDAADQIEAVADKAEIRRRVADLAARAERTNASHFSRLLCPLCGSKHANDSSLRRHLLRTHEDDVAVMRPELFVRRYA